MWGLTNSWTKLFDTKCISANIVTNLIALNVIYFQGILCLQIPSHTIVAYTHGYSCIIIACAYSHCHAVIYCTHSPFHSFIACAQGASHPITTGAHCPS